MLLIPLLVGVGLIGAGRIAPTPVAHNVAGIAALITFGLAIGVAIERPSVDRAWLPELGVRSSFAVDGISIRTTAGGSAGIPSRNREGGICSPLLKITALSILII